MGRSAGIIAMALFGAGWGWLGASATGAVSTGVQAGLVIGTALIVALALFRGRDGEHPAPAAPNKRLMWWAIGAEFAAIIVLANLLQYFGRDDLVLPLIVILVGLHFWPLARAVHVPFYRLTALVLVLVGLAGLRLDGPARTVVAGVGAWAMLWLTCLYLIAGRDSARD